MGKENGRLPGKTKDLRIVYKMYKEMTSIV